jgi:predicted esterase
MKNKYPNMKVFLGGMSLGGAISFHISIRSPKLTNGIIMLSPSIRENNRHYPLLKKLTLLLSFALPNQQLLAASARNGSKYKLN